jgi:TolA-binding protein
MLGACVHKPITKTESRTTVPAKVALEKKLRLRDAQIRDLKEKNEILKVKRSLSSGGSAIVLGEENKNLSEPELYSLILKEYRTRNEIGLKAHVSTFVKKYPKSPSADNALYLNGLLAVENHNYGEALINFNRVIKQYPNGEKVVAAMFAKAMTFKKMNLGSESKRMLEMVNQKYPGSPESFRASAELKMTK